MLSADTLFIKCFSFGCFLIRRLAIIERDTINRRPEVDICFAFENGREAHMTPTRGIMAKGSTARTRLKSFFDGCHTCCIAQLPKLCQLVCDSRKDGIVEADLYTVRARITVQEI